MLASDSDPPLRPKGLAKEGDTRFQLRPASPTGNTPNLYLWLFSNWRGQSRLGTTERGCPLGEDPRNQAEQIR